jgi:hypothetical protein
LCLNNSNKDLQNFLYALSSGILSAPVYFRMAPLRLLYMCGILACLLFFYDLEHAVLLPYGLPCSGDHSCVYPAADPICMVLQDVPCFCLLGI